MSKKFEIFFQNYKGNGYDYEFPTTNEEFMDVFKLLGNDFYISFYYNEWYDLLGEYYWLLPYADNPVDEDDINDTNEVVSNDILGKLNSIAHNADALYVKECLAYYDPKTFDELFTAMELAPKAKMLKENQLDYYKEREQLYDIVPMKDDWFMVFLRMRKVGRDVHFKRAIRRSFKPLTAEEKKAERDLQLELGRLFMPHKRF